MRCLSEYVLGVSKCVWTLYLLALGLILAGTVSKYKPVALCTPEELAARKVAKHEEYEKYKERWAATAKKYAENNKERLRERRKQYYEKNKDSVTATNKKWAEANRARRDANVKRWALANAEHLREWRRQYQESHRDQIRANHARFRDAHRKPVSDTPQLTKEEKREKRLASERLNAKKRWAADPERNRAASRARYAANREKSIAATRAWQAKNRDKTRATVVAYRVANGERIAEKSREKYWANPEHYREAAMKHHRENYPRLREKRLAAAALARQTPRGQYLLMEGRYKRRARTKGTFSFKDWRTLLDLAGHVCLCCRIPEAEAIYSYRRNREPRRGKLTVDHIIAISKGGLNIISNMQCMCMPCQHTKRTKAIDYRPRVIRERFRDPPPDN